jgi:hypothetical protein
MSSNLVSGVKFLVGSQALGGDGVGAKGQVHSWLSNSADERQAQQFETRLFLDPAFLKSVEQVQAWQRVRGVAFRIALLLGLALVATGYTGSANAEEGSGSTTTTEESPEPTSPDNWWDWLIGTMKDDGGTLDPEIGVE